MKNLPYEDRPHLLVLSRSFFFSLSHRSRSCSESYSSWCIDSRAYAIYVYIWNIERRFNLFFCLSHNSFAFVYRDEIPVTPRHVIIHGEERHGDPDKRPQVQREINKDVACYASATSTKRYVVACFPREMMSRGLKWGLNHREEDTWPCVYRERVAMAR